MIRFGNQFQRTLVAVLSALTELQLWWSLRESATGNVAEPPGDDHVPPSHWYRDAVLLARACLERTADVRASAAAIALLNERSVGEIIAASGDAPLIAGWAHRKAAAALADICERAASEMSAVCDLVDWPVPSAARCASAALERAAMLQTFSEDLLA